MITTEKGLVYVFPYQRMAPLLSLALLLLVAGWARPAVAKEEYPFPSFLRTLLATDPYLASYCLLTGQPGAELGVGGQAYTLTQPCRLAQVGLRTLELGGPPQLWVSLLGDYGVAAVDLGTAAALTTAYGPTATFASLRYDANADQLLVGTAEGTQPLPASVTAPLRSTVVVDVAPMVGEHIYLLRITEGLVTTNNSWASTAVFVKAVAVVWPTSGDDTRVPVLRWEILSGAEGPAAATLAQVDSTAASAYTLAAWGVALAVISLLALVATVVVARRRQQQQQQPQASLGGTANPTSYQAINP
jgi:hypothetical protein